MHEGLTPVFEKLLADPAAREIAILASTIAQWEGEDMAGELLARGHYPIFSTTPLDEPYTGPGVCLQISPLLEEDIDETAKELVFLAAMSTRQDAFAYLVEQAQ